MGKLLDPRAAAREEANREEEEYQTRLRQRRARERQLNRKNWIEYYRKLYLVHSQRASEFARRVEELQNEEEE